LEQTTQNIMVGFYVGQALLLLLGMLIGAAVVYFGGAFLKYRRQPKSCVSQTGNMMLLLFGAIAIAGVLGTGFVTTIKGPGRALDTASRTSSIENNMLAATKLVVAGDATKQDCDGDGTVEPMAFRSGAGPAGGGLIPLDSGAAKNDPWGRPLGYCIWDHGKKSVSDNVATCGGLAANRLQGGDVTTENVLAIISAGKDGIFQTTCNAWVDANTDNVADTLLIAAAPGSDDIVRKDNIVSLLSSGALSQLPVLPDGACTPGAEGTMRYQSGVPQVCTTAGWREIGGDAGSTNAFTPTSGVNPATLQTSNQITMSGYFGTRTATVDNGGIIVVNGVDQTSAAEIPAGALVSVKGTSSAAWLTPVVFALRIGASAKTWTVTTAAQDNTPSAFSFANQTGMPVSTVVNSNIVQVTGITGNVPTSISGSGASYRTCSDAACSSVLTNWTTGFASVSNNQYLQIRLTSSVSYITALTANMTVGTVTAAAWSVATNDATPNAFSFIDQTGVARSVVVSSNIVQISGITGVVSTSISGAGADYRVCSDATCSVILTSWTTSASTIQNNQYVQLRATSSASYSSTTSTMVVVGTFSAPAWSVTTVPNCAGAMVGGYCWYMAASGGSCTSACSPHGGVNLTGLINYAGSSGNATNCQLVANAFGIASYTGSTAVSFATYWTDGSNASDGCTTRHPANKSMWVYTPPTTASAGHSGSTRFCSCNN
jgi:hypothetical protein